MVSRKKQALAVSMSLDSRILSTALSRRVEIRLKDTLWRLMIPIRWKETIMVLGLGSWQL